MGAREVDLVDLLDLLLPSSWNNHGLVSTTIGATVGPGHSPPPATPRPRTTDTGPPGLPTGATAHSAKTGKTV